MRLPRPGSIGRMTASNDSAAQGTPTDIATTSGSQRPVARVSVLLYSDDFTTRDAVRAAVGRRPARGRRGGPLARVRDG